MKIGSYVPLNGKIQNIEIFRPVQCLLFHINYKAEVVNPFLEVENLLMSANVTLQDSKSGSLKTIIPHISLLKLAQIATYNEGFISVIGQSVSIPVFLNPASNIIVDNDKYLSIELINISGFIESVDVYGLSASTNSDFVAAYNKMNIPIGVSRHKFDSKDNEILLIPKSGFDEIQITHDTGIVSIMDKIELQYLMDKTNDLTMVRYNPGTNDSRLGLQILHNPDAAIAEVYGSGQIVFSSLDSFIVNLIDVVSVEIIRDTDNQTPMEFLTVDFVPTAAK